MMKILILAGPSGSGKTYIEKALIDNSPISGYSFVKLQQVTTRPQRENESPDTYLFIDDEAYDYLNNNGKLTGRTSITTDDGKEYRYGTLISPGLTESDNIIYTVILNKKGYEDFLSYVADKDNIVTKLIVIDSKKPEAREGRNEDFVNAEREDFAFISDIYFLNRPEELCFIEIDDIIEACRIIGYIDDKKEDEV